jgi:hypothetical protein
MPGRTSRMMTNDSRQSGIVLTQEEVGRASEEVRTLIADALESMEIFHLIAGDKATRLTDEIFQVLRRYNRDEVASDASAAEEERCRQG